MSNLSLKIEDCFRQTLGDVELGLRNICVKVPSVWLVVRIMSAECSHQTPELCHLTPPGDHMSSLGRNMINN